MAGGRSAIASASAIGVDSRPSGRPTQSAPGKNGNGHKPNNGSTVSETKAIREEGGPGNNGLANRTQWKRKVPAAARARFRRNAD